MPGGGRRVESPAEAEVAAAGEVVWGGSSSEEDAEEEEACLTTGGSVTGWTPLFSSASILMSTSVAAESLGDALGDALAGTSAGASAPPSDASVGEAQRATMASASALSLIHI